MVVILRYVCSCGIQVMPGFPKYCGINHHKPAGRPERISVFVDGHLAWPVESQTHHLAGVDRSANSSAHAGIRMPKKLRRGSGKSAPGAGSAL
jgi:hypothetical protein